ncbi:MAG: tRNA (N(6)-L-threonylcarbamoyladenosine(37)-C(2))-methylthiotransferase MtaB [Lachnospiraceae bacterium]|jgi:threonylcarbamoyladenosine tRNA methylthiotransferase MtaB
MNEIGVMKEKMKVAFQNLGCRVNEYETETMARILKEKGFETVPFKEGADVYIINTCTVTNIADRKSRQMLHRAKKLNKDAVVIAAGCYVNINSDKLEKDSEIDILVKNDEKEKIYDIICDYFKSRREDHDNESVELSLKDTPEVNSKVRYERCRAFLKVQDGCNMFCTYCIIPYARGRVTSRRPEEVIEEVKNLGKKGYKEVVVSGIHISSYGIDFPEHNKESEYNHELLELIKAIAGIEEIKRIRLGSVEPRLMTEKFVEELSKISKLCPQFHLSLQSGCDATLKRMHRHYDTKEYYEICCRLRSFFDGPAITTDVITGFPGETEEEFEESYSFVKSINFSKTHIFKYSRREGTKAASMPGQLTDREKSLRSERLISLDEENEALYAKSRAGKISEVLFEEKKEFNGKMMWHGYTREYVSAFMESEEDLTNKIIVCNAQEAIGSSLLCTERD